jgi:hypothetical protein
MCSRLADLSPGPRSDLSPWRRSRRPGRQARRLGALLSAELLLVLPLLLALILAGVQFAVTLSVEQKLAAATRDGARVAATGGNRTAVVEAVERVLGPTIAKHAEVCTVMTDSSRKPLPSGEPVQVVVKVPAAKVVPDLLRIVGYSIRNETLVSSTVMRKE